MISFQLLDVVLQGCRIWIWILGQKTGRLHEVLVYTALECWKNDLWAKDPKVPETGCTTACTGVQRIPCFKRWLVKTLECGRGLIKKRAENRNKLRLQKILALSPVGSEWLIAKGLWYDLLEDVWSCDDYLWEGWNARWYVGKVAAAIVIWIESSKRGRGLVRLLSSREVGAALSNGRKRSRKGKTRPEMTGNDNIRQKAMMSVNCMY